MSARAAPIEGETEDWGVSLEVNWDLGGATLTSITGYRDYQVRSAGRHRL